MSRRTLALIAALIVPTVHVAHGQAPPQRASEASPTQVSAILVDVVVRDGSGNPVRGLEAADFEIYEDGVRQDLGSVTPVFRDAPAAETRAAAPAGLKSGPTVDSTASAGLKSGPTVPAAAGATASDAPEIIALVFDRLTADSRALAHSAAVKYLESGPVLATNYMAVFGIDIGLLPYQTFTRDKTLIRAAIDKFADRSTSQYGSVREGLRDDREQQQRTSSALSSAESAAAGGDTGAAAAIGAMAAQQQFANMQNSMTQTFEALERDQAGYATSNALLAVVNGMRAIPGRKSIVFFSEGLAIPPNVQEQFRSVVAAANRANVSIYPMDAMGLRAESDVAKVRDEMLAAANATLNRNPTRDPTGSAMMAALERNEDLLRMDPHAGLGQLADETGGILIANTNDLRAGFRRIETDMRNYYLLTYVPSNEAFDGKFRQIEVKVRRSGLDVHSRKGYFAVREAPGVPVRAYEAPALVKLEQVPVPNAFPVWARALHFPEPSRPNLVSVIVQVPTSAVTFQPSDDRTSYESDFTVLVRFKDAGEQIVDKLSQRYEVNGPIAHIEQAKNGQVIFYRQPELPPGLYTMETVVFDALSGKASVRYSTVEQPDVSNDQLQLSSLMLVSRGERVPDGDKADGNPLYVGDMLIYPNLGTPLKKDADSELAFFFTAYPGQQVSEKLSGSVELLLDAKVLARAPMELAAPDAAGRVQQITRLPIGSLAPGRYQLRVRVQQGETAVARSTEFRIVS